MEITRDEALQLLRDRVREAGSQKAFALRVWVSDAYLSLVLAGHKPIGGKILKEIGLEMVTVTVYRKVEPEEPSADRASLPTSP